MSNKHTPEQYKEALDAIMRSLSGPQAQILETMQAHGVKGIPNDDCECVISRYVRYELHMRGFTFEEVEFVPDGNTSSDLDQWSLGVRENYADGFTLHKIDADRSVAKFAYDFDKGEYQDLIDPAYRKSEDWQL